MFRFAVIAAVVFAGSCAASPPVEHSHTPTAPARAFAGVTLSGPAGQSLALSPADFVDMPRLSVAADFHGEKHSFEGVDLSALLARAGAPTGPAMRGAELTHVVIVTARDGYRVALSLAETDASVTTRKIILADRQDGRPIPVADGPFRLVVEGDLKPARSARMVESIEVRKLE